MKLIAQRVRGMLDVLPSEGQKWLNVLNTAISEAKLYGFKYVRTPVLEQTELFNRSVGEYSDIVSKEMYVFKDRKGRDLCLRPEGTSGVMRSVLENGLYNQALPIKLMYHCSCYRYEKPQQSRYREFFQFGLEILGSPSGAADAQLICAGHNIIKKLGIKDVKLNLNYIGCKKCRSEYTKALEEYFKCKLDKLCKTCRERLVKNPLRILDCKESTCKALIENAPVITDFLCIECIKAFDIIKTHLNSLGVSYTVDPKIVRGLDYYTGIVFEFLTEFNGACTAICGGGRYDSLSQVLGGPSLPAVGFGFGMERILEIMEFQGINLCNQNTNLVYIAAVDFESSLIAEKLCESLRKFSVASESDISSRSLKSQIKYADKLGASHIIVIGHEEIETGKAILKEMKSGLEFKIPLDEKFAKEILRCFNSTL